MVAQKLVQVDVPLMIGLSILMALLALFAVVRLAVLLIAMPLTRSRSAS